MAEAVLRRRPPADLDDQVEPHEVGQRRHDLIARKQSLEQGQAERASDHARHRDDLARARGQTVEPRLQRTLHERRHRDLAVGQLPGAVAAEKGAALDQVLQRLLEEERVPARAFGEQVGDGRGQGALGQGIRQLAARVGDEWPQLDLPVAVGEERAGALAEPPRGLVALGAVDEHEPELHLIGQGEQVLDELDRQRVRPLEVVDHDAERPRVGEPVHDGAHRRERLLLDGLASELSERRVGLRLEWQREQAREERVGEVGAVGEAAERRLELEPHACLRRVRRNSEPVAQEVAHRPVGEALRVGAGPPFEEPDAIAEAPARLAHEARLADARLAHDRDDRAAALGDRLAGLAEDGELGAPPHERHDRTHLRRPACARDPRHAQWVLDTADLDLSERFEIDAELHLPLGLGTDHDAAVRRHVLQARGDVGRVAEGVVAVGAVLLVRQHDRPRVQGDAHRELDPVAAPQILAVGGDRGLDRQRGAHGALGVVLVPDGGPEDREQAIPQQLRHRPVEAPHLRPDQRHDLVEQELGALGAEPLADRGRADDVREQDRDDALGAGARNHSDEL